MRLFIAEKPDMGRKIASFLPGPHAKKNGYIETGGGMVTWCFGHLISQASPDAYGEQYAKFPGTFEILPILPGQWITEAIKDKQAQISTIKQLLRQCDEVIHAGDPGREGQLIVDELLDFLGNRKPVQRIILNALDKKTVTDALDNLLPNSQFESLYHAALGRQRADWLIGMNLSRAYSILGQRKGYAGALSIGRVQTPTLAIVVKREEEIENFVPSNYWSVKAQFGTGQDQNPFWTTWLPPGNQLDDGNEKDEEADDEELPETGDDGEAIDQSPEAVAAREAAREKPAYLDAKRRVIDEAVAKKVIADIVSSGTGTVTDCQRKPAVEQAPLLYDLTALQSEINRKTGAPIKAVLDATQKLYEAGHVSYPRTDCTYINESQHAEAPAILDAVFVAIPDLAGMQGQTSPERKSRVFSDKKMVGQEHYGIVPTATRPNTATLEPLEAAIYDAVCRRYLAQFMPDCLVDKTTIEIQCAQWNFATRGRVVKQEGWRALYSKDAKDPATGNEGGDQLPMLDVGQQVSLTDSKLGTHTTTPPSRYTEGTLVKTMQKIHRMVDDPVEKAKLRSLDGIGRTATRAAILENLLKRKFLIPEKNKLKPSSVARILVRNAPRELVSPGLTARWETALDAIATGRIDLPQFESKQIEALQRILEATRGIELPEPPPEAKWQPGAFTGKGKGSSKGKGKPAVKGPKCPKCKKGVMTERTVKNGPKTGQTFKGCTNYPECKHSEWPK